MSGSGAFGFNGTTDRLLGDAPFGSLAKTLEAWFKTSDFGYIVTHGGGYQTNYGDRISVATNGTLALRSHLYNVGVTSVTTLTSAISVADGRWHHAVMTRDGGVVKGYLDGQLFDSVSQVGTASYNYSDIGIGSNTYGNDSFFAGAIDEVALYDHALTATDVAEHYLAAGVGPIGGAVLPQDTYGAGNCSCDEWLQRNDGYFPVNTATGNFWHTFIDVAVPGRGIPLSFNRTYNTLAAVNASSPAPLGYGWTHNYNASLVTDTGSSLTSGSTPTVVVARQENGSEARFTHGGSSYHAAPRVRATLTKTTLTPPTWVLVRDETLTMTFDDTGRLIKLQDANQRATTLARSTPSTGLERLTVTEPAGRTLLIDSSTTTGLIHTVTDTSITPNRTVQFGYDTGNTRLQTVTDVAGRVTTFGYDSANLRRLKTWRLPGYPTGTKGVLENTYDSSHRVISQRDFDEQTTTYAYDHLVAGQTKISTPPYSTTTGAAPIVNYDRYEWGLLVEQRFAVGTSDESSVVYERNTPSSAVTATTHTSTGLSRKTTATYDSRGNKASETAHFADATKNRTTTYTYNSKNMVETITEPMASEFTAGSGYHKTTFVYEADGVNLKKVERKLDQPAWTQPKAVVEYVRDLAQGRPEDVLEVKDARGKSTTFTYDPDTGYRESATDPLGNKTTYDHDDAGRLEGVVEARGNVTNGTPVAYTSTFTYAADNRPLTQTDPQGHVTTHHYDSATGLRDWVMDPNGRKTYFEYDALGRVIETQAPDPAGGATPTVTATDYWWDGQVKLQTDSQRDSVDPNGKRTSYYYSARGQLIFVRDNALRGTDYSYDKVGNLVSIERHGGDCEATVKLHCTRFTYNDANEVTFVDYSDATPDVTYTYDRNGRRKTMIDGTGTTTWNYDSFNRVVDHITPTSTSTHETVSYGYDDDGRVTTLKYPGPTGQLTLTRTYDDAGRMNSITDWLGNTSGFSYDEAGRLETSTQPGAGGATAREYDTAGRLHNISRTAGGTPQMGFNYGRDANGQLTSSNGFGVPNATERYDYTALDQLNVAAPVDAVDAGDGYSLALKSDGQVYSWGGNALGQLGTGNTTSRSTPGVVGGGTPLNNVAGLSAGQSHALAVKIDGSVWAWGLNDNGQLGNSSTTNATTPVSAAIPDTGKATQVAGGGWHSLVLRSDGTVAAFGDNAWGQLGLGDTTDRTSAVAVTGLQRVVAISAGRRHSLALTSDGSVWSWGSDAEGQLGDGTANSTITTTPTKITTLSNITSISAGAFHSVAVKSDGTVWTWGDNDNGQMGNGQSVGGIQPTPTAVAGVTGVISATARRSTIALKSDGTLLAWGDGLHGQLGNGDTDDRVSPTPVVDSNGNPVTDVTSIAGGELHYLATKRDGTVHAWGLGLSGQLGNGSTATQHRPVAVTATNLGATRTGERYGYDTAQRIATTATGTTTASYAYDLADQLCGPVCGTGQAYNHDDFGRRTYKAAGTNGADRHDYTWNLADRLTGVKLNSSSTPAYTYTYNGDGLRTAKTVNSTTTRFTWDANGGLPLLLKETDGTNTYYYIYGPDGRIWQRIDGSNNITHYHLDQLGSVRMLTSGSGTNIGAVVGTASYDAYGTTTSTTGTTSSFGWAGEYRDLETGFVYLRARMYDAATRQFISRDPLSGITGSPYAYAGGAPTNLVDPSGLIANPQDCRTNVFALEGPACYTVYESVDDSTGLVTYVGITNDFERRAGEHRGTREIRPFLDCLTKDEARGIEQHLIDRYGFARNGGTLTNQINSIAMTNKNRMRRMWLGGTALQQRAGYPLFFDPLTIGKMYASEQAKSIGALSSGGGARVDGGAVGMGNAGGVYLGIGGGGGIRLQR